MHHPGVPCLTNPKVKLTICCRGYIVISWKDDERVHAMNYHVESNKQTGSYDGPRQDI